MNNILEYKGYCGSVEFSTSDNVLFGKVLGIKSLISYEGDSVQTLKQDFESAVDDYIETCEEKGLKPEKAYKGTFNVRIEPALHRQLAVYSSSHGKSLNAAVEEAIRGLVE